MNEDSNADTGGGISRRGLIGGLGVVAVAGIVGTELGRPSRAAAETTWWFPLKTRPAVTSPYGYRTDPYSGVYSLHDGVDFGASGGAPIYSMRAGTVTVSELSGGYGEHVFVQHDGGYLTGYGHMSQRVATVGQTVQAGSLLGYVGSTGWSTGNHLHLLMHLNGATYNPTAILNAAPLATGSAQPIDVPDTEEDDVNNNVVMIGDASGGVWMADIAAKTKWNLAMGGLSAADAQTRINVYKALGIGFFDNQPAAVLKGFTDITSKNAPYA